MRSLRSVTIQNFRLIQKAHVAFDSPGVYYIGGENTDVPHADSNMSGKTTYLNAITWALYGCDLNGSVITSTAIRNGEAECKVTLAFDDGVIVSRTRYKTPKNGLTVRLYVRSSNIKKAGRDSEMQRYVDELFGVRDIFLASHVFGYSDSASPFALRSDKEQKRLFDLLIDSDDFDRLCASTTKRIRDCEKKIAEADFSIASLESRRSTLNELLEKEKGFSSKRLFALKTKMLDALAVYKSAREKSKHADAALKSYRSKVFERLNGKLSKKQSELSDALISEFEKRQDVGIEIKSLRSRFEELEALSKSAVARCPLCENQISDEHVSTLLDGVKTALENAKTRAQEISEHIDTLQAAKTRCLAKSSVLEQRLERFAASNNALSHDTEVARATYRAAKKSFENERAGKEGRIGELSCEISKASLEHASQTKARKHLVAYNDLLMYIRNALSPKGIRAYKTEMILPHLNAIADEFSGRLFGDGTHVMYSTQKQLKSGDLAERFDVSIFDPKGELVCSPSAGQSMRRDIIHALSMVRLCNDIGKRSVHLLIFDETFRTLDRCGIETCIEELHGMSDELIFVAEHDVDLSVAFEHQITARRKAGRTSLIMV